jgi:hypothetical protein
MRSINNGEVALDSSVSLATEQTLVKCLMTIAISANTEMLPVLHPGYHANGSNALMNRTREAVQTSRKKRANAYNVLTRTSRADWLNGTPVAKKQKTTSTPRRDSSADQTGPKPQRKRKVWTDEETEALRLGMEQYGNDWVAIHRNYSHILIDRHPVSLKDRARSMRRILERNNQPLGVWASASRP